MATLNPVESLQTLDRYLTSKPTMNTQWVQRDGQPKCLFVTKRLPNGHAVTARLKEVAENMYRIGFYIAGEYINPWNDEETRRLADKINITILNKFMPKEN